MRSTARSATSSGPTTRRVGRVARSCARLASSPVPEDRCGQRRVDEPRCDHVDAAGSELEGEASRQRGHRRGDGGDERSRRRTPPAGAADQQQASVRLQHVFRQTGDLDRQHDPLEALADLDRVELHERHVAGTGPRHEQVVDRSRKVAKNRMSRSVSLRSNAEMLAPSSRPTRCRRSGSRAVRIRFAPSACARRAVSSPMPEVPPSTTTVRPARLRSHASCMSPVRAPWALTSLERFDRASEVQLRVSGLEALAASPPGSGAASRALLTCSAKRSESRRKSSSGASEIALMRSLIAAWPAGGKRGDPVCEGTHELVETHRPATRG